MKTLVTILGLVCISFPALAKNCESLKLAAEMAKISANKDINEYQATSLYNMAKATKVSQILRCAELGLTVSREEGTFAEGELQTAHNNRTRVLLNEFRLADREGGESNRKLMSAIDEEMNLDRISTSVSIQKIRTAIRAGAIN